MNLHLGPHSKGFPNVIHQTVVPGFEFTDHDFMAAGLLPNLLADHQADELRWLLSERA